jgi:glycosyltransferase involved in cell wall biosynthesis
LKSPILSVLMTSYNRERFIAEAIESVQQSSFNEWELIIVDDGSSDQTVNIAKGYAATDDRISVYINEQNLGDYPNRNRAASYAKGIYMMYVDSDDKILRDGFERCLAAMILHPQADFGMRLSVTGAVPFYMSPKDVIHRHFFGSPCLMMGPGGTIIRRSFFEQIGRYPILYGPANDMFFNLKAASESGVLFLPFVFNFYRIHEGQELNNKFSYFYNGYNYLNDALLQLSLPLKPNEIKWLTKKNKRRFIMNLMKYYFKTFDFTRIKIAVKLTGFKFSDFLMGVFNW